MVELTHGGMWIRWSSLERIDKLWFSLSCGAVSISAAILSLPAYEFGYAFGYRAGAGGRHAAGGSALTGFLASDDFRSLALLAIVLAVIGALAWWRFSIRQDEMFNRIQNYALGHGSAWATAIGLLSWMATLAGIARPLSLGNLVLVVVGLVGIFWTVAVRRWA